METLICINAIVALVIANPSKNAGDPPSVTFVRARVEEVRADGSINVSVRKNGAPVDLSVAGIVNAFEADTIMVCGVSHGNAGAPEGGTWLTLDEDHGPVAAL